MKISYNWLTTFLPKDLNISIDEISEILTDTGLEVEGVDEVETVPGGLKGLVIGEVVEIAKHPNADKLNLTKVNVGTGDLLDIVCGAPNVDKGQKVVVATVGAKLYPSEGEPFEIKKSKIRGEASVGMLCAEDEIGLGEGHAGIMVLNQDAKVGTPAAAYFNIKSDYLIEIGLTPNRSDAMSHYGVARDLLAAVNVRKKATFKIIKPTYNSIKYNQNNPIKIEVADAERCPKYTGVFVEGITVKESPDWLKNNLLTIGLTPKNNVVDITNYICHGLGHPLHAFDASKITTGIVKVQTLKEGTPFTTLDGEERKLSANDLMICNGDEPMCIAGVFGGMNSGVSKETTSIFLEAAYFNPVSVRKTAKRHALNTDASFRYERGIDPNQTQLAAEYALSLILDLAGGTVNSSFQSVGYKSIDNFTVAINTVRANKLIGADLPEDTVEQILNELDITVTSKKGQDWVLSVNPYRVDVQREADIVEEILRIYGYNNIEMPSKVQLTIAPKRNPEPFEYRDKISNILNDKGYTETMSNSLTSVNYGNDKAVAMLNPLSSDLGILRTDLLFSLLTSAQFNANRQRTSLQIFEIGKTYEKQEEGYKETEKLGMLLVGSKNDFSWQNPTTDVNFYDLKNIVLGLVEKFGIAYNTTELDKANFEYGLSLSKGRKDLGFIARVDSKLAKKFDLNKEVFYAEINVEDFIFFASKNTISYKEISKFPAVRRELSLLLNKETQFADLQNLVLKQNQKLIQTVDLFDVYAGKNLPSDKKAYTLSMRLQDPNKTLVDKDIEKLMQKCTNALQQEFNAELR